MIKKIINLISNKNPIELLIGIYIVFYFLSFILYGFRLFYFNWVSLPYQYHDFSSHPWTLFTYSFFHGSFVSLIFNSILLFYFGNIFLSFFNEKKFWKIYFSGVIFGALFFLISYYLFPDFYIQKGALLGASAGIMAILTYLAIKQPSYAVRIRFLGFFKLIHILIFLLVLNLLQIPLGNPGGYFAHLGGLLAGLLWIVTDKFLRENKKASSFLREDTGKNYKVNKILEKINSSGYESLTEEEKDYLFKQGK